MEEQVEPALAQSPDMISIIAGGNDILRPHFDNEATLALLMETAERIRDAGVQVLMMSGPDPTGNLPLKHLIKDRAEAFNYGLLERARDMSGVVTVDNFSDRAFEDTTYWSEDGLHLSPSGHIRVAANILDELNVDYPATWGDPRSPEPDVKEYRSVHYFNTFVAPWIGRRLTGRSSGDGRVPKRPVLHPVEVVSSGDQG